MPIEFKLSLFPIILEFAMATNNSQGQTLFICGLDLGTSCFHNGQFYVAWANHPVCLYLLKTY